MTKPKRPAKKSVRVKRRIVLGEGFPWYTNVAGIVYSAVYLRRGLYGPVIKLWAGADVTKRARLVLEVLE